MTTSVLLIEYLIKIYPENTHSVRLYHGGWLCFEEVALLEGSVSVVSPGAYVVSDGRGDVDGSVGRGLFYRDVRHLSEFRLKIDGESPVSLASRTRGLEAKFVLAVGDSGSVGVTRRRSLGGGMNEEILLTNETRETIQTRSSSGARRTLGTSSRCGATVGR
jgi:glycogen debranching enzyme-like protein